MANILAALDGCHKESGDSWQTIMIYGKDRMNGKDTQTVADIIEDLEREENDNNGTDNIENGIGVDFEDNSHSRSLSTSRTKIKRVDGAEKTKTSMNTSDKAEFYGIAEILGYKVVVATKELTKSLGTEHLITQRPMQLWDKLMKITRLS
ncbi:hypothetical protein EPI10_004887 [Gossypium australe]|uniref:Uncharacterized protein n=1 Tax=Gossypium australe TaxID=47621 RepID=A0A5B6WLA2_9ROSI|nr:hypothetical protein EPI10_004887 [Gossypium australe]